MFIEKIVFDFNSIDNANHYHHNHSHEDGKSPQVKANNKLSNLKYERDTIHESRLERSDFASSKYSRESVADSPPQKIFKSANKISNLNYFNSSPQNLIPESEKSKEINYDNFIYEQVIAPDSNDNQNEKIEKKFKKFFTSKGKMSFLAKRKFSKMGIEDNIPKEKVFNEIFEQTRPSTHEKNLLLRKENYRASKIFNKENITSFLILLGLSINSFFEGLALGLVESKVEIVYLLIAVIFHKWVEALTIVSITYY